MMDSSELSSVWSSVASVPLSSCFVLFEFDLSLQRLSQFIGKIVYHSVTLFFSSCSAMSMPVCSLTHFGVLKVDKNVTGTP